MSCLHPARPYIGGDLLASAALLAAMRQSYPLPAIPAPGVPECRRDDCRNRQQYCGVRLAPLQHLAGSSVGHPGDIGPNLACPLCLRVQIYELGYYTGNPPLEAAPGYGSFGLKQSVNGIVISFPGQEVSAVHCRCRPSSSVTCDRIRWQSAHTQASKLHSALAPTDRSTPLHSKGRPSLALYVLRGEAVTWGRSNMQTSFMLHLLRPALLHACPVFPAFIPAPEFCLQGPDAHLR